MGDNKLLITVEPKTFHFNLPKDAGINLKHKICSVIKHNELNELRNIYSYSLELFDLLLS